MLKNPKSFMLQKNSKTAIFIILFFVLGIIMGAFGYKIIYGRAKCASTQRLNLDNNSLTNPILECEQFQDSDLTLVTVKSKLNDFIRKSIDNKSVTYISVYVRDLNNGPWIGINEKKDFSPSSLLKVPIMMAFYKIAENNPALLGRQVKYENETNSMFQRYFPPKKTLRLGETYTINELIERMIIYSDNIAKDLLLQNIDFNDIVRIHTDLGLVAPNVDDPQSFLMSVKNYSSFFRILYNASYLSRQMSEKALELLTRVDFDEGLSLGLPKDIKIAHKFGEADLSSGIKQLHDCGIVYYPGSPYLICVMTQGKSLRDLTNVIKEISSIVYEHKKNK